MRLSFSFLLLAGVLAGSCSPDKNPTDKGLSTTTQDVTISDAPAPDTITYYLTAKQIAALVIQDLQLSDTAEARQVRRIFRRRAHGLAIADVEHNLDTTGFYASRLAANDEADAAIRKVFTSQQAYRDYLSHRSTYYGGTPYRVEVLAEGRGRGPAVIKREVEKDGDVKIKYADGSKLKLDAEDGDRKVKSPYGLKTKTDGDDGSRKVKR